MAKPPSKSPGDFEVGRGRPPTSTQFKPGQSGNPKGRPKGQPTPTEIVMREAARLVRVRFGDRVEKISKIEAIARKLLQMAMEGNLGAARLLLSMLAPQGKASSDGHGEEETAQALSELPDDDVLRRMVARFDGLPPR